MVTGLDNQYYYLGPASYMSSRPIISLRLPKSVKDALTRSGYETARDILSARPETISRGKALFLRSRVRI